MDPLFVSAAEAFGIRTVGILLTGRGVDGVKGLICIKSRQGFTIVQDPREAHTPSMPLHGLQKDHVDVVTSLKALPSLLVSLAIGKPLNPACAAEMN